MCVAKPIAAKLIAWREHDCLEQTEIAKLAAIPQGRLSDLENEKGLDNNFSYMIRIVRAMRAKGHAGASLDWLIDPAGKFPPPDPSKAVVITDAEAEIIRLAHEVSESDDGTSDPTLRVARRRLIGATGGAIKAGELSPGPGEGAVEIEARESSQQARRNAKGRA